MQRIFCLFFLYGSIYASDCCKRPYPWNFWVNGGVLRSQIHEWVFYDPFIGFGARKLFRCGLGIDGAMNFCKIHASLPNRETQMTACVLQTSIRPLLILQEKKPFYIFMGLGPGITSVSSEKEKKILVYFLQEKRDVVCKKATHIEYPSWHFLLGYMHYYKHRHTFHGMQGEISHKMCRDKKALNPLLMVSYVVGF